MSPLTLRAISRDEVHSGLTPRGRKRTKIVATIGPASESPEVLKALFYAGVNVVRLNMSHGDLADHQRRLDLVRRLSSEMERPVAVLADLQGPKMRIGRLRDNAPVLLTKGSSFTITTAPFPEGDHERVGCTYDQLARDVIHGNTILLDDGRLKLRVEEVVDNDVRCTVVVGGRLTSSKGINLPGVRVSAPSLSDKDKEDLAWAINNRIDYLALSFVRTAHDIRNLRRRLDDSGFPIPIIAKIEREEALDNVEEIIRESDGIMVARGDLGIEISTQRLPIVQKHLIRSANAQGKLVITATQMLESMIENPIPTRAESSDVANAIFDGTDAVMLSGETAMGKFPVEAVSEMGNIAAEAEKSPYMPGPHLDEHHFQNEPLSLAVTGSAHFLASTLDASGILLISSRPHKGILLSKRRYPKFVVAVCPNETMWRRMALCWGVIPLMVPPRDDPQDMLEASLAECARHGIFSSGDTVVALMGTASTPARTIRVVDV